MRVQTTRLLALSAATLLAAAALAPAARAGEKLRIDPNHSAVSFSVRHLFTQVNGQFRKFEGALEFDEKNVEASKVTAIIQAASVDTNVENRDQDLRSKRFFDVETYPTLEFHSEKVTRVDEHHFTILGKLTMHGVTKEVSLDTEFLGKGKDPWGNLRYGFHAETTVNRKDFGMQWNEALETGGFLVGDDVKIVLDIEAVPASS
ncbi:MAG TPA: YceI family protein [Candidatus Saccharimonadales bacterium]|nr:YceI family protein [Candidatus Saccharimonadales bacterium]